MPLSIEQVKDRFPDDHAAIDKCLADAKAEGCTCTAFFKTREEMMAEWDELTPQQRAILLGNLNPDAYFCEHDERCDKRRMSMAPYN